MGSHVRVTVSFDWAEVGWIALDENAKPVFPALPTVPGIYKLMLTQADGTTAVYVGEADNLRRRSRNYRTPGPSQRTSLRINAWLKEQLPTGGRFSIVVATNAVVEVDGVASALDLGKKASRLLAENAALVTAILAGVDRIENL